MKKMITLIILLMILSLIPITQAQTTTKTRNIEIKSVIIKFDKTDATAVVYFDFPTFKKIYLLLIGSKNLEPVINKIFSNFDYKITKLNDNMAELKIRNISRYDSGYYLHNSHKFGTQINTLYIYTPEYSKPREYTNLDSTPNIFYR